MRRKVSQELRREFKSRFKAELPDFKLIKHPRLFPGFLTWAYMEEASPWFTVTLFPSQKDDEFTIEIGWSRLSRFPETYISPPPYNLAADEILLRLGYLTDGRDFWWRLVDEIDVLNANPMDLCYEPPIQDALDKVSPSVDDVIQKLRLLALPFFEKVAAYQD